MLELSALVVFISVPIWISVFKKLIETIYLWQVKEYRLDRVLSHLKYEGSLSLNDEFELVIRIAFLTLIIMYYLSPTSLVLGLGVLIAMVYYDIRALKAFEKLLHKKIHRFALKSPRNLLVFMFSCLVLLAPYLYLYLLLNDTSGIVVAQNVLINNLPDSASGYLFNTPLAAKVDNLTIISLPFFVTLFSVSVGILMDLTIMLIVPLGVFLTAPFSVVKRNMIIKKAIRKMAALKRMRVIAVTGSYGKTTTKEIIYQILEKKFNTIKTEKHNNTEIGIAQTVLKKAGDKTQVFVAEMGAYKLGETRECAKIVNPHIAIITGIDEQHISLYGSFKAIIDSTLEIVEEIAEDGLVIINADNDYCLRVAEKIEHRKALYYTDEFQDELISRPRRGKSMVNNSPKDENLYLSHIEETSKGLSFDVSYKGTAVTIKSNIKGRHNAGNISAGILAAIELGMDLNQLSKIINETNFDIPYLTVSSGMNESKIIDDGYNINPSGYYAGLKFLSTQKNTGKKWVLTQGFIELGDEKDDTYKKVALATIKGSDGIITTDIDLCAHIVEQNDEYRIVYCESVFDVPIKFKTFIKNDDVVLVEGPFPKQILDNIYKKNNA